MRRFLVAWGMVATLLAQQPELQPVGTASARGGRVVACAFDGDGTHMLTVGADGDVVYQDLTTFEVLSRHELPGSEVSGLCLHAREARALVAVRGHKGARGAVLVLDLASGSLTRLVEAEVELLVGDCTGERVAWYEFDGDQQRGFVEVRSWDTIGQPGAAPQHRREVDEHRWELLRFDGQQLVLSNRPYRAANVACLRVPLDGAPLASGRERVDPESVRKGYATSPDGRFAAVLVAGQPWVREFRPQVRKWDLGAMGSPSPSRLWISPRGQLLVADQHGLLHVLGPDDEQHRLAAMHRAPVLDVVWTPDGRYLAVLAAGGTRFVDCRGQQVGEHVGTSVVVPGTAGPELFVFDRSGFERLNVPSGRRIGGRVTYTGPSPDLFDTTGFARCGDGWCGGLLCIERVADGSRMPASTEQVLLAEAIVVDDHGRVGMRRLAQKPRTSGLLRPKDVVAMPDRERTLVAWARADHVWMDDCYVFAPIEGVLQLVDVEGMEVARVGLASTLLWLRCAPGGARCVVGLENGEVWQVDATNLEGSLGLIVGEADEPLQWFDFVDEQWGLGGDGERVWWIDTRTFARTPVQLPAGIGKHCVGVVAPDGKHVALISGCEVTIAAIR